MLKPSHSEFQLDPVIIKFLHDTGLAENRDFQAEPLTGGVASDIWKIRTGSSVFVVKKALARLRSHPGMERLWIGVQALAMSWGSLNY